MFFSQRYYYPRRRKYRKSRQTAVACFLNCLIFQDSVSVENALYSDERVLEVAAVGVPDKRLGELVAAVVSIKPAFHGKVTEASLISVAQKRYFKSMII